MAEIIQHKDTVPESCLGKRFDQTIAEMFPEYSRSRLKEWILAGFVTVNGDVLTRAREKMYGGETIAISTTVEAEERFKPQNIDLNIIYEDDDILVINKPAGLVVHPGAGNPDGTVLNALLHHCPQVDVVPRAGIVHRLDKDTTGLMVIAKTIAAQTNLVESLQAREITREYEAIASGVMTAGGLSMNLLDDIPQNELIWLLPCLVDRLLLIIESWKSFVYILDYVYVWKQEERIKSVSIWHILVIN